MFNSSNEQNIKLFFDKIKFDKKSYKLYTNILTKKTQLTNYLFVLLICQSAQQLKFDGNFHDLYYDVIQNRIFYIKQININMKKSYLCTENIFRIILNNLCGCYNFERENKFDEYISAFKFDKKIGEIFIGDDILKLEYFTTICHEMLLQNARGTRIDRIFPIS